MNETQYDIEIREFSVLTEAGEVLSESLGSDGILTVGESENSDSIDASPRISDTLMVMSMWNLGSYTPIR